MCCETLHFETAAEQQSFPFALLCWLWSAAWERSVQLIPGSNSTHMKLDIFLGNWLQHRLITGGKVPRVPLRMSLRSWLKPQELYRELLVFFFCFCLWRLFFFLCVCVNFGAYRGLCANLASLGDVPTQSTSRCTMQKNARTITPQVNTTWRREKRGRRQRLVVVWGGNPLKS